MSELEILPEASLSSPNPKLGPLIMGWSIPAGFTCPGETPTCGRLCYAKRGHFRRPSAVDLYERNLAFSTTDRFAPWMHNTLRLTRIPVLRIHVAGDFYDEEYVRKWIWICQRARYTEFYTYTRSWRNWSRGPAVWIRGSALLDLLTTLGQLPNVQLWWSTDRDTGRAPDYLGIRSAYMAVDDDDAGNAYSNTDLIFRNHPKTPAKRFGRAMVCPVENGIPGKFKHSCTTCGFCWDRRMLSEQVPAIYAPVD